MRRSLWRRCQGLNLDGLRGQGGGLSTLPPSLESLEPPASPIDVEVPMERSRKCCHEWAIVQDRWMYISDLPLELLVPSTPRLLEADPTPLSPMTLTEVSNDCFLARG